MVFSAFLLPTRTTADQVLRRRDNRGMFAMMIDERIHRGAAVFALILAAGIGVDAGALLPVAPSWVSWSGSDFAARILLALAAFFATLAVLGVVWHHLTRGFPKKFVGGPFAQEWTGENEQIVSIIKDQHKTVLRLCALVEDLASEVAALHVATTPELLAETVVFAEPMLSDAERPSGDKEIG
jgi:hypothetical protein